LKALWYGASYQRIDPKLVEHTLELLSATLRLTAPSPSNTLTQRDLCETELQRSKMRALPVERKWQLMQAKRIESSHGNNHLPSGYLSAQYFIEELKHELTAAVASSLSICLRNRVCCLRVATTQNGVLVNTLTTCCRVSPGPMNSCNSVVLPPSTTISQRQWQLDRMSAWCCC
jgi:hypothetical protein